MQPFLLQELGSKPLPPNQRRIPKEMDQRVRFYLETHACTLEQSNEHYYLLIYPEGTTRQEILPRGFEERYRCVLPDGAITHEVVSRDGLSMILVPTEEEQRHLKEDPTHDLADINLRRILWWGNG